MLFLKSWTLIGYTRLTHPVYSGASEGHSIMVNSQVPGVPSDPRSCAGCGGKIADRFLLFSMERYWHTRCLKCSCCQAQLGDIGTTCYSKGGMILCRSDYIRWEPEEGGKGSCWFLDFRGCRSYENQIFVFVFADCLGTAGRAVPAVSQFQPTKWWWGHREMFTTSR